MVFGGGIYSSPSERSCRLPSSMAGFSVWAEQGADFAQLPGLGGAQSRVFGGRRGDLVRHRRTDGSEEDARRCGCAGSAEETALGQCGIGRSCVSGGGSC